MASKAKAKDSNERSILPEHFVDILEDAFHGLLGINLIFSCHGSTIFYR
jgi:hypothetical protein